MMGEGGKHRLFLIKEIKKEKTQLYIVNGTYVGFYFNLVILENFNLRTATTVVLVS